MVSTARITCSHVILMLYNVTYLPTYLHDLRLTFPTFLCFSVSVCLSLFLLLPRSLLPASVLVQCMTCAYSVSVSVLVHGQVIPQSTWCQRLFAHYDSTQVQPGQNHANAPPAPESAAPTRLDRKCLRPSDRLMRYRQLGLGTGTCSNLLALHSVGASGSGTAADWAPVDTAGRL